MIKSSRWWSLQLSEFDAWLKIYQFSDNFQMILFCWILMITIPQDNGSVAIDWMAII